MPYVKIFNTLRLSGKESYEHNLWKALHLDQQITARFGEYERENEANYNQVTRM